MHTHTWMHASIHTYSQTGRVKTSILFLFSVRKEIRTVFLIRHWTYPVWICVGQLSVHTEVFAVSLCPFSGCPFNIFTQISAAILIRHWTYPVWICVGQLSVHTEVFAVSLCPLSGCPFNTFTQVSAQIHPLHRTFHIIRIKFCYRNL